jgi:hypothetical protein
MFERYTEKARRVIFFARYEASQFGSPYIETEHLLLGLLREDKALTNRFLRSHASVESIRKQIVGHTTIREKVSTSVDLPLSNECKRVLAYAAEESERLSHKHIGTEHMLLGLLREQGCFAAQLLQERGISLESAREIIASQPWEGRGPVPRSQGIPAGYASHELIYNPASETLIVELRGPDPFRLPTRLFMRRKDADAYEKIGDPAEVVSYESPVTCEKQSIVMFNSKEVNRECRGQHWGGVYAFNLNTKELTVCVPKGSLSILEPHLRVWVVELVSLSDDAQKLYMNVGIEKEAPGGGVVHYYLAEFDLAEGKLQILSELKDVRF